MLKYFLLFNEIFPKIWFFRWSNWRKCKVSVNHPFCLTHSSRGSCKVFEAVSRGVLKKAAMKNFIKSIGKYLQWNSSSNKVAGLVLALQVFSPEFCGFFRIAILHSIPGWLHLHLWSKEEDGPIAVYCTIHQRNLTRSHMRRFLKHWNVMKKIGPSFSPFFD